MRTGYILIADDESSICELIRSCLELAGFNVKTTANGQLAYQAIIDKHPDLLLLDWMMPKLSGIELTHRLKRDPTTSDIPIIMLTAREQEDDRITGLDAGADDYISKPFSPRELIARVRAVLRRTGKLIDDGRLTANLISIDRKSQQTYINNQLINLGPLEFRLLEFFMLHQGRVYSRPQLLDRVWGGNVHIDERTVDVHIRRLRKALSIHSQDTMIQTVRGSGYRFSKNPTSIS